MKTNFLKIMELQGKQIGDIYSNEKIVGVSDLSALGSMINKNIVLVDGIEAYARLAEDGNLEKDTLYFLIEPM